jgi:hypothetical protein
MNVRFYTVIAVSKLSYECEIEQKCQIQAAEIKCLRSVKVCTACLCTTIERTQRKRTN